MSQGEKSSHPESKVVSDYTWGKIKSSLQKEYSIQKEYNAKRFNGADTVPQITDELVTTMLWEYGILALPMETADLIHLYNFILYGGMSKDLVPKAAAYRVWFNHVTKFLDARTIIREAISSTARVTSVFDSSLDRNKNVMTKITIGELRSTRQKLLIAQNEEDVNEAVFGVYSGG